jgi:hypothetical protein
MKRCFSSTLLLLLGLAIPAVAAEPAPDFMVLMGDQLADPAARGGDDSRPVLVKLEAAQLLADPAQLSLPLPGGRLLIAVRSGESVRDGENFTWNGELQQEASAVAPLTPGSVSFYLAGGRLFGSLRTQDGLYFELQPEGELHRLVRYPAVPAEKGGNSCGVDHGGRATGEAAAELNERGIIVTDGTESDCATPGGANKTVTVLVLYPRSLEGSATAVNNYAVNKIAESNNLFGASNVKITYQLVPGSSAVMITGEQPPPPLASGGIADPLATGPVLDWLTAEFASDGIDTEVEILRNYYGADLVVVVVPFYNPPPGTNVNCGVANLPRLSGGSELLHGSSEAFDAQAFAVVELGCGDDDYTFAHELGHTFGMRHDNDSGSSTPVYPWAFGHLLCQSGTNVGATVMGCFSGPAAGVCDRVLRFSHPDIPILFGGLGTETGVHTAEVGAQCMPRAAHNACVANLRASMYEAFESAPPTTPPTLSISSPSHGATITSPATFTGTASDAQDGSRTAFIQWSSDRQGALGTGSPLGVTFTHFGKHIITATVSDTSGTKISKAIEVLVSESTAPQRYVDTPAHNQQMTGSFTIVAWALDDSGVVSPPTFQVDGSAVTVTNLQRSHRADVCAAFPTVYDPNCPMVGWTATLNTSQMTNGTHTLSITFKDPFNNTGVFNRTFRTQNSSTVWLNPTADAWVSEANPTTNYGTAANLEMRATGSGLARHAYLKFDLSQVTRPPTSVLLQVRTGTTAWTETNVYRLATTSWTENGVNWNNGPLDPLYYLQLPGQAANSFTSLNLTSMFPSGGGLATLGIVTTNNPGHYFLSRESGFNTVPILRVDY